MCVGKGLLVEVEEVFEYGREVVVGMVVGWCILSSSSPLARNVSQRGESGASEGNCTRGTEGQGPSTMKADYPKWEIDFNQIFCPEGDVYFDDEKILLW